MNHKTSNFIIHTSYRLKESPGSLNYVLSESALFFVSPHSVAHLYSLLPELLSYTLALSLEWLSCHVFFGLCSLVGQAGMSHCPHLQVPHILQSPKTMPI